MKKIRRVSLSIAMTFGLLLGIFTPNLVNANPNDWNCGDNGCCVALGTECPIGWGTCCYEGPDVSCVAEICF